MAISSTYIFGHRRKAKKTLGYLIARSFRTNWKTQRSPNLVEALSKNLPGLLHATFVRVAIRCVYRSPTVNALVNEKVHDCVSTDRNWSHRGPSRQERASAGAGVHCPFLVRRSTRGPYRLAHPRLLDQPPALQPASILSDALRVQY